VRRIKERRSEYPISTDAVLHFIDDSTYMYSTIQWLKENKGLHIIILNLIS
jgi:hypothetical protein